MFSAILDGMKERRSRTRPRQGLIDVTVVVPPDRAEAVKSYARRVARRKDPARRDDIIDTLRAHRHVAERFGVAALSLFGSVARDDARADSDIDLLVEFLPGRPRGLFEFVELKNALEGILSRPVDLITPHSIKPRLRDRILGESVRVL